MSKDTLIAVDLAKSAFEVLVSQQLGRVRERCRLVCKLIQRCLRGSDPFHASLVVERKAVRAARTATF